MTQVPKTFILTFIFCIFFADWSLGFDLSPQDNIVNLNPEVSYWIDEPGSKDISELISEAQFQEASSRPFRPVPQIGVNLGPETKPVWYQVQVANRETQDITKILTTGFLVSHNWVYLLNEETGEVKQIALESEKSWVAAFKITFAQASHYSLFVRAQSQFGASHITDFKLYNIIDFWAHDREYRILSVLFYAALFTLGVYNFFLFLTLRDKLYLIYVLMLGASVFFIGSIDNMGSIYLWHWENIAYFGYAGAQAFGFLTVLFTQRLLSVPEYFPRLNKAFQLLLGVFGVCFVSSLVLPLNYIQPLVALTGLVTPILLLLVGILSLSVNSRLASIYLLAWSVYLVAIATSTAFVFGFPILDLSNEATGHLLKFGSLLEILLFSFALADRINLLHQEKINAQAALAQSADEHAGQLESMVTQRTIELQNANDTKDKFFSIISHDLKGPIGGLSVLFSEVLEPGEEIEPELFNRIRNSTSSTFQLLEDLLYWAKNQKGEVEYNPYHFALINSVYESLNIYENQALQKGILLNLTGDASYYVFADAPMVTTIIRNLVNNAIKFTSKGGKIVINMEQNKQYIKFSVKDDGVGIKADTLEKLFKIEEKVKSSVGTQNETGTGLGLIMCKEFAIRNGGKIGVNSELGKGAEFWFTLPLGDANAESKEWSQSAWLQRLESFKILAVEEDLVQVNSTKRVLEKQGINFKVAKNGKQALDMLRSERFDLVLTAIDMPEMDGIQLTREIQKIIKPLPWVVPLSSYSMRGIEQKAEEKLFEYNLTKPLDQFALQQLLQELLTKSPEQPK
ncbi:MAG: 7TM diverse intracellular signaling domain-containing protein [SAR324 cluster bacterium]|nr:7TM diverse intracellular signaling domain-containing protein [SAR324 cluster bacterium]